MFIGLLKIAISKLPLPEIFLFRVLTMLGYTALAFSTLPFLVSAFVFFYLYQNAHKENFLRDA